ncbi:MAG: hypothetical protein R2725_08525 [Solirubrobacterales bacterium]
MGGKIGIYLPFVIAVLLPPAGLMLGLIGLQEEREKGIGLLIVSVLAAIVWTLVFVA